MCPRLHSMSLSCWSALQDTLPGSCLLGAGCPRLCPQMCCMWQQALSLLRCGALSGAIQGAQWYRVTCNGMRVT